MDAVVAPHRHPRWTGRGCRLTKVLGGLIHEYQTGSMTLAGPAIMLQVRADDKIMEPHRPVRGGWPRSAASRG
jgi:hypothetical protein